MKYSINPQRVFPLVFISLSFAFVFYRAFTLSMTHDESSTIFNLENYNVFTSLFNKNVWLSANNHWLNSMGIEFFTYFGGYNEISIRLSNVLLFPFYALSLYYILLKIKVNYLLMWASLVFFILNPILIDFFSLARGYGMGTSFLFIGLAFYYRYFERLKSVNLIFANLAFILAGLSLFSNVIYFFIFNAASFVIIFFEKIPLKKYLTITTGSLLVLVSLTIIPLTSLSKSDEFRWGTTTLKASFISFSNDYLRHAKYFISTEMLLGIFISVILISILGSLKIFSKAKTANDKFYLLISLGFIFLILSMLLSKNLLDANYPETRKTILYLPFVGFLPIMFMHYYADKAISYVLSVGLIIIFSYHFYKSVSRNTTLEWWYDWDTKNIYKKIIADSPDSRATLGSHWMFNPTLNFYNHYMYEQRVKLAQYNKDIDNINQMDYFVCFRSELEQLQDKYDILYENMSGILILKAKQSSNNSLPPSEKLPTE
ncbi:MAG: hypothetical protein IPM42_05575 [Saprospiraceae bacterium]|nr:hypothetical protein [Saprospiraceae bacterium]